MKEFRKRYWYEIALCASFFHLIYSPIAYSAELGEELVAVRIQSNNDPDVNEDNYTVNFNNISIIEFIRFASKITNLNFVFDEADLQFAVTIVSEEAVSAKNVMAALSQVLRMHDLILIQEDGNVLITKSKKVNQIPPIISPSLVEPDSKNAALVTRVFRIKNANVNTIAGIIRPMCSDSALIEVSVETRQMLVTDVATNVEQIASLLISLDTPHSSLEVESYVVKHIPPEDLVTLTHQILSPFSDGNPLIFVPQDLTNSIFIVSTPHLIERAITVMEDLDRPPQPIVISKQSMAGRNIFLYKAVNRSADELIRELHQISRNLKKSGGPKTPLEAAIDGAQAIQDTNSLMFIADPDTVSALKDILAGIDSPSTGKTSFYLYKIQRAHESQIAQSLKLMIEQLQASPHPDKGLIDAINSMRWINETNALIFTGTEPALKKLADILPTFDVSPVQARSAFQTLAKSNFLIYTPEHRSGAELSIEIQDISSNLENSGLADPSFLQTLNSMKWVANTNSLVFTGDPQSIEKVRGVLQTLDVPISAVSKTQAFFLYKLQYVKCDIVIEQLKKIAAQLPTVTMQNENLITTISTLSCIPESNSLLITGPKDAVDQVKALVADFDIPKAIPSAPQTFLIYKPVYLPPEEIEIALRDLAMDLQSSGLSDTQLFEAIKSMHYVAQTHSLLFTGTPEALDKVDALLKGIDSSTPVGTIQHIGTLTFFLYKIQYANPEKLIASLKSFAMTLNQANVENKQLADTLSNVKWIKETNSLLFTGSTSSLEKVEPIVKQFDIPSLGAPSVTEVTRVANTFVIYNPKYLSGDELISILCDFMQNLMSSGVSDPGLFDAIDNLRWMPKISGLLISGDQESVSRVEQLLAKFDIPSKEQVLPSIEAIDNTSFLVYKLQYHPGNDIQSALKQVAISLGKTTPAPTALVDAINSLQWIEVTNSLLVSGHQDVLVRLKDLIQNLDVPLRQVFIEVLVIETSLTNSQQFGLMWGGQAQYLNRATLGTGNFPVPSSQSSNNNSLPGTYSTTLQGINATNTPKGGQVPFATGFDLGVIGDIIMHKGKSFISLGALVNALQVDNDSTIVLNPKIVTQDNRQSTIFVGQNVPYTGALTTVNGAATTQTSNVEYRDVGVSLTITPILGESDVITMDIVHDISELTNALQATSTAQVTGLQTSHTHMETRVHVPDNYFVALSGMINDSKVHYRSAIPCLGGLPVIGALFSENDRFATKTNVIIFVRPKIIKTYAEYKQITEHQEWLYKDNARLPILKEEFDEGIDLVKLPENE